MADGIFRNLTVGVEIISGYYNLVSAGGVAQGQDKVLLFSLKEINTCAQLK